jgi:hypothetical protein
MAIGRHVCDSWNITKQKKFEIILQCPFMKSPFLWYGNIFFLKRRYYYAFILEHMEKKTHFLNEISSKNSNFLNGPKFN